MVFPKRTDVCIIGGGFIGSSVLYHLSKLGISCVLLEKHLVTSGTTWHTAGMVPTLGKQNYFTKFVERTRQLSKSLTKESSIDTGWITKGRLNVATNKSLLDEIQSTLSKARVAGYDESEVRLISSSEAKTLYPQMNTIDLSGILYSKYDGVLDPSGYCSALVKVGRDLGAQVLENCSVNKINTKTNYQGHSIVTGVDTDQGTINSDIVVNCAGAWAPAVSETIGIKLPMAVFRHAYFITDSLPGVSDCPLIRDYASSLYISSQGDSLIIGGFEPNPIIENGVPTTFSFGQYDYDWSVYDFFLKGAVNRVPIVEKLGVKSTICGPESFTPDLKPLIGEMPEVQGYIVACAMNSSGAQLSGGVGYEIAHLIKHGHTDTDLSAVSPARFTPAGDLISDQSFIDQRAQECFLRFYWPSADRNQFFSGRESTKRSSLYQVLGDAGCYYEEDCFYETPAFFIQTPCQPLKYDWYGFYGNTSHETDSYKQIAVSERSVDLSPHLHTSIAREYDACRNKLGLFDASSMAKVCLVGPEALDVASQLFTRKLSQQTGSQLTQTLMLSDDGKIISKCSVAFFPENHFSDLEGHVVYTQLPRSAYGLSLPHIQRFTRGKKCLMVDCTDDMSALSLYGKHSSEILHDVVDSQSFPKDIVVLKHNSSHCQLVLRNDRLVEIYRLVMGKGEPHGITNIGSRCLEILSIEDELAASPYILGHGDSVKELGLEQMCKRNDDSHFIGCEALEKEFSSSKSSQIGFLKLSGMTNVVAGHPVYQNSSLVGTARGSTYSFRHGCVLVACTLQTEKLSNGQKHFVIDNCGTRYDAKLISE